MKSRCLSKALKTFGVFFGGKHQDLVLRVDLVVPSLPAGKVQLTEQQRLLGAGMHCKQCVMAPHDIVSSLYEFPEAFFPIFTGEPGRIESYWRENIDLYNDLGTPDMESWPKI